MKLSPFVLVTSVILVSLVGFSGCSVDKSDVQRGLAQLDELLRIINDQSKSWQDTLKSLEDKAAKDVQSTIRNEVNDTIQRGVAATGAEFRCNADFMRDRVKQHLLNIKNGLLTKAGLPHDPITPLIPVTAVRLNFLDDQ